MKYFLILTLILFTGCSSLGGVVKEAAYVNEKVTSGEVEETISKVDLSVQEEQILTHSLNQVVRFRENYGEFLSDPGKLLTFSQDDLNKDYDDLRDSFKMVQLIVIKNWPKYSKATQDTLTEYQKHAYHLDQSVQELIEETKYRGAIKEALSVGFALVQIIGSMK